MPADRTSHLVAALPDESGRPKSFYRSFMNFLFSNLGLVIIVIAYCIGGAFLFTLLEQYIELQNCQQGNLSENISISNLSETMYSYVVITDDNTTAMYAQMVTYLTNFTKDINQRRIELRYAGQDCTTESNWNFPSALLFAITVITTIGYGHVTPTSWEGQITCICYALIGIPIFLLCVANISSVLGDIFRFMYSGLLHCFCCACRVYTRGRRSRKNQARGGKTKSPHGIDYTGSAPVDPTWPEAHSPRDAKFSDDDDDDLEEDYADHEGDIWDRMESRVPFGAVIVILSGYICLGAFMFSRFENWTFVQSLYFSYITLATIGFGDYVPGITSGSTSGLRFLLASLYILFGLSILAMCFDLIKEGIVDKFRWFAHKIGIIADEDDQVDDDRTRYANFEYDTPSPQRQPETNVKRFVGKTKSNEAFGEPPRYEVEHDDGQWMKNIRDKDTVIEHVGLRK